MAIDIKDVIGDKPAQEEGKWIDYENGVRFLLIYSDSKKPRSFYLNGLNKLRRKAHGGIPKTDKQQALMLDMLVLHVVKGWEGFTTGGQEFPYSIENCRKLLEDSTVIRDWVTAEAADITNFGGKEADDDDETEDPANADMKSRAPVAT